MVAFASLSLIARRRRTARPPWSTASTSRTAESRATQCAQVQRSVFGLLRGSQLRVKIHIRRTLRHHLLLSQIADLRRHCVNRGQAVTFDGGLKTGSGGLETGLQRRQSSKFRGEDCGRRGLLRAGQIEQRGEPADKLSCLLRRSRGRRRSRG